MGAKVPTPNRNTQVTPPSKYRLPHLPNKFSKTTKPVTDEDLVTYASDLSECCRKLARTGTVDALGGTWKNIKSLRAQVGPRTKQCTVNLLKTLPKKVNTFKYKLQPDAYLRAVLKLLEAVRELLYDESRVLLATEVAKLATFLIMCLVAFKQIQDIAPAGGRKISPEEVKKIEYVLKQLVRSTAEANPHRSPTNGLMLELSLLQYGSKSLHDSHMKQELGKAAGKVVGGIAKTILKGGFPDPSIWVGLRDAAVAVREGADEAVAIAVFRTALCARSKTLELMGIVGNDVDIATLSSDLGHFMGASNDLVSILAAAFSPRAPSRVSFWLDKFNFSSLPVTPMSCSTRASRARSTSTPRPTCSSASCRIRSETLTLFTTDSMTSRYGVRFNAPSRAIMCSSPVLPAKHGLGQATRVVRFDKASNVLAKNGSSEMSFPLTSKLVSLARAFTPLVLND